MDTPESISGLEPTGAAVIARVGGEDASELVLISGDGSIDPLVVR